MNRTFCLIGGDRRFSELADLLKQDGYTVRTWRSGETGRRDTPAELDSVLPAGTVLLPLPLIKDGRLNCSGSPVLVPELLDRLAENGVCTAYAGMVPEETAKAAARRGVTLRDYFREEAFTVANAAATADAAVVHAVQHRGETFAGKRCLVLGFGRIGKLLCQRLHGLGASVTAAARRASDRAWVRAYGYGALDTAALAGQLGRFDAVFNTVPAPLLTRALLGELPPGCLLMELASRPGGFRPEDADGLDVLPAPSLPGRLVPRTAAACLRDTILSMIQEGEGT